MSMDYAVYGITVFYSFLRNVVGIGKKPYETYRQIMKESRFGELVMIGFLTTSYFAINAWVKSPSFRPFVLTRHFVKTSFASLITAVFVSLILYGVGKWLGGRGQYKRFLIGWGYTLIPTLCWFLFTSILYVVFPPPRTTNPTGIALSVVFLTVSGVLFFWKFILSYLALRFGLRLDLVRIIGIFIVSLPILFIYSFCMYTIGIFKIPFM